MPDEQVLKGAQGGLSKLAKILISAGAVTFLALVALAVFFIYRSRKNKNTQEPGNVLNKEQRYQEEFANPFKFIQPKPEGKNQKTIKGLLDGLSGLSSRFSSRSNDGKAKLWRGIVRCASELGGIEAEDVSINFKKVHSQHNVVTVLDWMLKDIHKLVKHGYSRAIATSVEGYKTKLNTARTGLYLQLDKDHKLEPPMNTTSFNVSDYENIFSLNQ